MAKPARALDLRALEAWLAGPVPGFGGPIEVHKFETGQSNPTYRLTTPGGRFVLRRKPDGKLLKSAHAVEREYRVQAALAKTDVPVPRMYVLCEDETVIGTPFYLMEYVPGRSFDDPRLPGLQPAERGAVFAEMNRVLAAIHDVDIAAVGLFDYGPEGNYYQRQTDRWTRQYRAAETGPLPEMDALIDWLAGNVPPDDGQRTLVHGDFRIDNLLFAPDGPGCVAVLDWELSTVGHPYADLAAVIMQWRMPPGPNGRGLAGIDRAALGLPEDQAFIAEYCRRRGIGRIDRFGYYLAFCMFRMAAILQGVKKRALDGNASNPERAMELATLVPDLARAGLKAANDA